MQSWSITFLGIALITAVLGFLGLAGTASSIAWTLFVVFMFASLISLATGRQQSAYVREASRKDLTILKDSF